MNTLLSRMDALLLPMHALLLSIRERETERETEREIERETETARQ